jgi:diguanylate cyclase (GGDEF)-like protein
LDAPTARLDEIRGELAKTWLLRAVELSSLEEIERLPTPRIVRELPDLIGEIARAAAEEGGPDPARGLEWVKRLAELTGRGGTIDSQLIRDVAGLQSVIITALHRQVRTLEPAATLRAVERLTDIFSSMQADAVEEVLRQRSRELEWLGSTDELTGLHNSRFLHQHMLHLVNVQRRYGHPFALLLVDIEGLKRINDAYGSAAGDRALVDVSAALAEAIRAVDTPVRMDDDEFCILLPNQTASRARRLAERVAESIEAIEGPAGQTLGVAVGVVSCPQHATEVDKLLEVADSAMYRAKAAGEKVAVGEDGDAVEPEPEPNGNGHGGG